MRHSLTLLFLVFTLSVRAQVARGDLLITLPGPPDLFTSPDLARAIYNSSNHYRSLSLGAHLGYALSHRLVIGASSYIYGRHFPANTPQFSEFSDWSVGLSPYLRYYAIKTPRLGIYGEVSSPFQYASSGGFYGFNALTLTGALQLPLSPRVRLGPALSYATSERNHALNLLARLEVILGKAPGQWAEERTPSFRRGMVMLGGQHGRISLAGGTFSLQLGVGGHYFLTDRFAAGLLVGGYIQERRENSSSQERVAGELLYYTTISGRYYLSTQRRVRWFTEFGTALTRQTKYRRPTSQAFGDSSRNGIQLTGTLGGQYFLRDHLGLEFGPQLQRTLGTEGQTVASLHAGIRFLLH